MWVAVGSGVGREVGVASGASVGVSLGVGVTVGARVNSGNETVVGSGVGVGATITGVAMRRGTGVWVEVGSGPPQATTRATMETKVEIVFGIFILAKG